MEDKFAKSFSAYGFVTEFYSIYSTVLRASQVGDREILQNPSPTMIGSIQRGCISLSTIYVCVREEIYLKLQWKGKEKREYVLAAQQSSRTTCSKPVHSKAPRQPTNLRQAGSC